MNRTSSSFDVFWTALTIALALYSVYMLVTAMIEDFLWRHRPEEPDFCPHGVIPPDDCPTCRH